eukprot:CAMPEP_0116902508 /NCGR_PEP_ID=MMETSP0467-20121206/10082_1 /TAXON_ID=283647 /ORGANISM="Mesodinium pulex, Strain SPMC105" /LENGTH=156 /DNA_ID=CAMNT_0004576409 /DNA_START=142 /DNA_END=613 /DNA_ORIENTATION=+
MAHLFAEVKKEVDCMRPKDKSTRRIELAKVETRYKALKQSLLLSDPCNQSADQDLLLMNNLAREQTDTLQETIKISQETEGLSGHVYSYVKGQGQQMGRTLKLQNQIGEDMDQGSKLGYEIIHSNERNILMLNIIYRLMQAILLTVIVIKRLDSSD